jgi:hypothetical protein
MDLDTTIAKPRRTYMTSCSSWPAKSASSTPWVDEVSGLVISAKAVVIGVDMDEAIDHWAAVKYATRALKIAMEENRGRGRKQAVISRPGGL